MKTFEVIAVYERTAVFTVEAENEDSAYDLVTKYSFKEFCDNCDSEIEDNVRVESCDELEDE